MLFIIHCGLDRFQPKNVSVFAGVLNKKKRGVRMDDRTKGILYLLIVVAIWGLSFVITKVVLAYLDPAIIVFARFLIATILLLAICRKRENYTRNEI